MYRNIRTQLIIIVLVLLSLVWLWWTYAQTNAPR
jgi:hypothetical protein